MGQVGGFSNRFIESKSMMTIEIKQKQNKGSSHLANAFRQPFFCV